MLDPQDTIVAVSSARGGGARAVVRLSGSRAFAVVRSLLPPELPRNAVARGWFPAELRLPALASTLPADVHVWPAPRTYTGEDVVELHVPGSPPLVDLLIAELLGRGTRAARPGEFTLRAFLAGKLDLTRAEAVLQVIEAGDRDELRVGLARLAGGVDRPLAALRDDLLNLLADVEAGLDFSDEDIRFVEREDLLTRLEHATERVQRVRLQLEQRGLGDRPFRAVLVGPPNAGKSSLFNALAGAAALVSPLPGTTRDFLIARMTVEAIDFELVDTAGREPAVGGIAEQAQSLGTEETRRADLLLLCLPGGDRTTWTPDVVGGETATEVLHVATKCDLSPAAPGTLRTSAVSGEGVASLRECIVARTRARKRPHEAPGLSRCRHHLEMAGGHLEQAARVVRDGEPTELLALELRLVLQELGELVGAVYTDDLLDRVFSRFCIGK